MTSTGPSTADMTSPDTPSQGSRSTSEPASAPAASSGPVRPMGLVRGTGRRKTSVARVRFVSGTGRMTVNGRDWQEYFTTHDQRTAVRQPLKAAQAETSYDIDIMVRGGGIQGQADAVRHGLARALASQVESMVPALREAGFLTRDSRRKERKKYGQRGARARFQFSKR